MTTVLTKSESKYIREMFVGEGLRVGNLKNIKKLPLGCAGLFLDNRESGGSKKEWPLDYSISEKYLSAHKLPINTTYRQWMKWLDKQEDKS